VVAVTDVTALDGLDGGPVLVVVPTISESDPPRTREGVARRRLPELTGTCACGARLILVRATAWAAHTVVQHDPDCPAIDPYGDERGSR
jgi:hypothetical protein